MKSCIILCLLVAVACAATSTPEGGKVIRKHPRGCLWILGKCSRDCEEGTHGYMVKGGCGHKIPEATCENPNPQPEKTLICDYSACYCDEGTVRDTMINKCVKLEDCSKLFDK